MTPGEMTGVWLFTNYLNVKNLLVGACLRQNIMSWIETATLDELLEVYKIHGERFLEFVTIEFGLRKAKGIMDYAKQKGT